MDKLTITKPDDWHCHLRSDEAMQAVAPFTAKQFSRVVVMPNLKPPITTVVSALAYRDKILAATTDYPNFNPLMSLYLTDNTDAKELVKAAKNEHIIGVKYYPAGATTNSDSGVTDLSKVYECLSIMEQLGIPLQIHGEVTDPKVDVFDREKVFIDRHLTNLVIDHPKLRIVLEHITTKYAVEFVAAASDNVVATITPHHLLLNRNAMFKGGIRPHNYCLPVLKREVHRESLLQAATSGNPKFFLGTDSAPHTKSSKETACGCAGIFSAHAAVEFYAKAFEQCGQLEKLEGFASFYGADFYRLPRNNDTITISKQAWQIPNELPMGEENLIPFFAGESLYWKVTA